MKFQLQYDSRLLLAIMLPLVLFFRSYGNPTMAQQTDTLLRELEERYGQSEEELWLHYQYAIWEIAYCENGLSLTWHPLDDADTLPSCE